MRRQIWQIGGSGYACAQDKHMVKERNLNPFKTLTLKKCEGDFVYLNDNNQPALYLVSGIGKKTEFLEGPTTTSNILYKTDHHLLMYGNGYYLTSDCNAGTSKLWYARNVDDSLNSKSYLVYHEESDHIKIEFNGKDGQGGGRYLYNNSDGGTDAGTNPNGDDYTFSFELIDNIAVEFDSNYKSLNLPVHVGVPEGIKVFVMTTELTKVDIDIIPANTPVILYKESGSGNVEFPIIEPGDYTITKEAYNLINKNKLKGTIHATNIDIDGLHKFVNGSWIPVESECEGFSAFLKQ